MPPPAGCRGAHAAGGTARAAQDSSRTRDPGAFVSDAARASEVEKENAARAQVGGKRRRVPGLHHDLIVEDGQQPNNPQQHAIDEQEAAKTTRKMGTADKELVQFGLLKKLHENDYHPTFSQLHTPPQLALVQPDSNKTRDLNELGDEEKYALNYYRM